jgi:hypothetical protein
MDNETQIFPVAGWQHAALPDKGIFVIRPNFLSHLMQHPSEAQTGRFYALTVPQLREWIADAQKALRTPKTSAEQAPRGPKQ